MPLFSDLLLIGKITRNTVLKLQHNGGEIFYTLDVSDPRCRGGEVNPNAKSGSTVRLAESAVVTLRARKGAGTTCWSSPVIASFVVVED